MRTTYALVAAVAASVLLVGCTGDRTTPEPTASPTSSPTVTSTVTATVDPTVSPDVTAPASTPPPPPGEDQVVVPPNATTAAKTQEPSVGSQVVLSQIRTASHTGVDRVVLEFTGPGVPGWNVEYVDEALSQGSGDRVDVEGRSILAVRATGTTYPESTAPAVPKRVPGDGDGIVTEVVNDSTFEGMSVVFVGLDADERPFDVMVLQSPTRLVVDIVR